jgi:hypothetical protein
MSISSTGPSDWQLGPLVVKPKIAWRILNCSNTRGYQLLAAGELDSFLDGRSRKITVESIRNYIARRLDPNERPNSNPNHHQRNRRRRRKREAEM